MTSEAPTAAHVTLERATPSSAQPGCSTPGDAILSPYPTVDDDLRLVAPALAGGRPLLLAPVTAATWRAVSQATVGMWLLLAAGISAAVLLSVGVALAVLGVGVVLVVLTLLATPSLASLERGRLRAQLAVGIPAPTYRRTSGGGWWRRWRDVLADGRRWAHLAYAVLGSAVTLAQCLVVWAVGGAGLAAVASPFYAAQTGLAAGRVPVLVAGGLLATWVWPVALQSLTLGQVRLARWLLGRPVGSAEVEAARVAARAAQERASAAEVRAVELRETRTRAVGTAEDDRRRIERDLHDGAQQRLVALGVELGVARRAATQDPAAAVAALDHAHREVKETLAELRDLVRGIHPAVLTDRGLDAALSALAARCPVPVTVDVPDPDSLAAAGPSAQAAAYFVTAEALTNVARHSGARSASVRATVLPGLGREGDAADDGTGVGTAGSPGRTGGTGSAGAAGGARLRLEVADDGRGGAVARPGSGLDGLRSRVEVLDGTLVLDSPVGAGTRLTVEVPCAS